jgi:hypothetical protein
MAIIIREEMVCDGYDVDVILSNESQTCFHFRSQPTDVQAAVDALEATLPEEEEFEIVGEN